MKIELIVWGIQFIGFILLCAWNYDRGYKKGINERNEYFQAKIEKIQELTKQQKTDYDDQIKKIKDEFEKIKNLNH